MKRENDLDSPVGQANRSKFILRLAREVEILSGMSLDLQSGIHSLDMTQSTKNTRKVLQTADKLSQTLMCLKIALESLSCAHEHNVEPAAFDILDGIFLEDVRERLLNGDGANSEIGAKESGAVDLF